MEREALSDGFFFQTLRFERETVAHRSAQLDHPGFQSAGGANTLTVYYLHWILGWMFRDQISLWIYTYVEAGLLLNTVKALVLVVFCACIGAIGRRIPIVKHLFT